MNNKYGGVWVLPVQSLIYDIIQHVSNLDEFDISPEGIVHYSVCIYCGVAPDPTVAACYQRLYVHPENRAIMDEMGHMVTAKLVELIADVRYQILFRAVADRKIRAVAIHGGALNLFT